MQEDIRRLFDARSAFSAADLTRALRAAPSVERPLIVREVLETTFRTFGSSVKPRLENLSVARVLHTLGTALDSVWRGASLASGEAMTKQGPASGAALEHALFRGLAAPEIRWLAGLGVSPQTPNLRGGAARFAEALRDAAFEKVSRTIVTTPTGRSACPRNALRADEIVWGRAPARLDLGGGWTDTPPYSLEKGGCVINAAVDLNGQPPIQVFARLIEEPVIRINSIDHGSRLVIKTLTQLLDYRSATSQFGLAKAALVLSGFAPGAAPWPVAARRSLPAMLKLFGGGLELTTLAAIPSGSGLGTSSIMGAVLVAVIRRVIGDFPSERELFHAVLKLEQELTTGGGWQDQIGGVLPGVKVIASGPGLVPDPRIRAVCPDLLEPGTNGGTTLLYYTGFRRLAKNILRAVVGRYLDRDAAALQTLGELHAFPADMHAAMNGKDAAAFGRLIDAAWRLNKRIDPDSTTPAIERILARIGGRIRGAKLLGAGGGGFLLIVAKSPQDAQAVRKELTAHPPNARARFFEYRVSGEGLAVTVC